MKYLALELVSISANSKLRLASSKTVWVERVIKLDSRFAYRAN